MPIIDCWAWTAAVVFAVFVATLAVKIWRKKELYDSWERHFWPAMVAVVAVVAVTFPATTAFLSSERAVSTADTLFSRGSVPAAVTICSWAQLVAVVMMLLLFYEAARIHRSARLHA